MKIILEDLSISQVGNMSGLFEGQNTPALDNKMIGKYVIVRCHDAGVHAGFLESHLVRECVLTESRRLWYWKPADKQSFLSGVSSHGLDSASKVGTKTIRIHLTENCEIIQCTGKSQKSIEEAPNHEQ